MQKATGNEAPPAGNGTLLSGWYGPPKTYKTTGALMIPPEMRPVAYLETEKQSAAQLRLRLLTASAEQRKALAEEVPSEAGEWCGKQIDFYWPDPLKWYEDCWEFATRVANDYKWVILDSGSMLARGIMRQVLTMDYIKGRVTLGTGETATKHPLPADYGFAQDRYMALLQALDEARAHVLLISHEKMAEIREDNTKKLLKCFGGPSSIGNALLEVVPATMDLLLRLEPRTFPERSPDGKGYTGKILTRAVMRTINHGEGINGVMYPCGDRLGLFKDQELFEPVNYWKRLNGWLEGGSK